MAQTTLYDLLRLSSQNKEKLENIDKKIQALLGKCKTQEATTTLIELYREKFAIIKTKLR